MFVHKHHANDGKALVINEEDYYESSSRSSGN
jgi:hypothetical protein